MSIRTATIRAVSLAVLATSFLGCADSGGGPTADVQVSAYYDVPMAIGSTRQFFVISGSDTSMTAEWTLPDGPGSGSITTDGIYTASETPGTYRIVGELDGGSDTVSVEVMGDPPLPIVTLPDSIDAKGDPVTVSVVPPDTGITIEWQVGSGTILSGQGTPTVTFTVPDNVTGVIISVLFRNFVGLESIAGDQVQVIGRRIVLTEGTAGVAATAGRFAFAGDSVRVYNSVGRGRLATFAVADAGPMVFNGAGTALYVARPAGVIERLPIDGGTTSVNGDIGSSAATSLVLNGAGTALYAGGGGRVYRLDPSTLAIVDSVTLPVGGLPTSGLAMAGDGSALWVSVPAAGYLFRLRPDSLSMQDSVFVAGSPQGLAVDANGGFVYAANLTINPANGYTGLQVINTANRQITDVANAPAASAVELTPDGAEAWLGGVEAGSGGNFGRITRYSTATRLQTGLDQGFTYGVVDLAFSPDGLIVPVGSGGQGVLIRR